LQLRNNRRFSANAEQAQNEAPVHLTMNLNLTCVIFGLLIIVYYWRWKNAFGTKLVEDTLLLAYYGNVG
jgi:hypothetical protein